MKKVLLILLLVVVIGLGYAVYRIGSSLDAIVLAAIEKYGSEATGTAVEVGDVEIAVREGRATVTRLVVANPDGFEGDAFTLGEITVDIDPSSVTKDPVVIDRITIGAPAVSFIVHADGQSNLDIIRRNLESSSGGDGGGGDGDGGTSKRLRIKSFVFADGRIHADATAVGAKNPLEVDMPTMELTNVGGREGAPPDEVARVIAKAYTKRVAEVAAREGLEAAAKEGLMDKAQDAVKDLFD